VAFSQFDMGYAAAMAWVLTAIIFLLALLSIRFARKYATSSY
jgi:ABC-type sugar transport system permease subunit